MSDFHRTRASQHHCVRYFAAQRTSRWLAGVIFLFLADLAGGVEIVDVEPPRAHHPELDVAATSSARIDSDLIQIARQFGPRIMVSGALLVWGVIAPELSDAVVIELPPGEPASFNAALSRAGTAAALLTLGTATVAGLVSEWPDAISAVSASSAVIAAAYAARSYSKALFRRTRPSAVLSGPVDELDDRQSFPSGHALLAWAGVGDVLVRTVRRTVDPWLLATVTVEAVAVSCFRVAAGEHYPGDVVAGAAIGLAVGSVVSFVLLPL